MSIFAMRADNVNRAAVDRLHHATTAAEVTAEVKGNRAEVRAGCHLTINVCVKLSNLAMAVLPGHPNVGIGFVAIPFQCHKNGQKSQNIVCG